jgi:DNA-binding PadR family transcriptional regulator
MMILSLVEEEARHGYEILKLLEQRSEGVIELHIGSVYPILYRLEKRGWVRGEKAVGGRRRRSYQITDEGRRVLEEQRGTWREVVAAIARVARVRHA